jgi:hypothetical protein
MANYMGYNPIYKKYNNKTTARKESPIYGDKQINSK